MSHYRVFTSMGELFEYAREDKCREGVDTAMLNRYPVRFVLFENFADFREFVDGIDDAFNENVYRQGIDKWLDDKYPDAILTQYALGQGIEKYIKQLPTNDFVFTPFSELARFYDNGVYKEFDALMTTIRLAEPPLEAQRGHQRIYIPIIGMHSKMGAFIKDPNIHIWEYRTPNPSPGYQLVVTKGTTYGVQGLEEKYSTVYSVTGWLKLWGHGADITQRIICASKSIFDNAQYAMPDNAFSYCICANAFEFLTKGLGLDFGYVEHKAGDDEFWEILASKIDITAFDFDDFVNQRFDTYGVTDGRSFVKTWFECDTAFDRWLLSVYYGMKSEGDDYLYRVLRNCESLNTPNLIATISTLVFSERMLDQTIAERKSMLLEVAKHQEIMPDEAETYVKARLKAIASDPGKGHRVACKLLTPCTASERELMIEWVGQGHIRPQDIEDVYPELAAYTKPMGVRTDMDWLNPYFDAYKASKIANSVSEPLAKYVSEVNGSQSKFHNWHNEFKTTKTILANRHDIEIAYWIDGLGVDWVSYICSIIEKHSHDDIYLNEVYVATAKLPSRTSDNKIELQQLVDGELPKNGDLDSYAHKPKKYPAYIAEEFRIVSEAIDRILKEYSGKKIAIVSDHGISYMPQLASGLGYTGYESDHSGRCAVKVDGKPSADNNYIVLEDNRTVCGLNHNSLIGKVQSGQGAHGGALPEEVLVPIIIISSQKNPSKFEARLLTPEISAASPIVKLDIRGLSSVDSPEVVYNGVSYSLRQTAPDAYESERLRLVDTCKTIQVVIGENFKQSFTISVQTGVKEDDLFGDL